MQGNKSNLNQNKLLSVKNQTGSFKKYQSKNGERTNVRFKTTFYNTVGDVLKARGWQEAKDEMDWDLWWCDIAGVKELFDNYFIEEGRKICHFRNHYELTRKNLMVKNLKRLRKHYEKSHNKKEASRCDIYPTTYELPNEYHIFVEEFRKNPGSIWIMKPAGKSQGKGIFLFQKLKDITEWKKKHGERLQAFSQDPHAPPVQTEQPEPYVVQRYVINPYLIGGKKFDLRVYVLITSFHPLVAWLHREGFARFSNTRFSLDSIENIHIHLTNVAIQKTALDYDPERGCKWAMWKVRRFLMAKHGNAQVKQLIDEMNNIFIKSLQSVQKVIISDKHCFELYGYDILIDSNLKPWLLEVNAAPSLTASSSEDYALKFSLINDVLDVIDLENKRTGYEKRIGGFDLLWNDGPVLSTPLCPQCNSNSRPPVSSAFLGCANERKETPVNLIPPSLVKESKQQITSVDHGE